MADAPASSSRTASRAGTPLRQLELRCPPLPQTLVEALDLLDEPDRLQVRAVTRLVERDPAVVARLLQVVNSAYYGVRREISSARRAVTLLGPASVAGIVVSMNMLKLRGALRGPAAACFGRLIRHSAATAFLARHLAAARSACAPRAAASDATGDAASDAFTAGLLHDFGKVILVYNFPDEAVALYEEGTLAKHIASPDTRAMERLLFGCDHAEAGAYAAGKLRLPGALGTLIRYHHAPDELTLDPPAAALLRVVAAANCAAKAMGHAFVQPRAWPACEADPVWERLVAQDLSGCEAPAALARDARAQQEHVDEYVRSLSPARPPR